MHEFSIANPIVKKVLSLAKEKNARKIKTVDISVGELILLGAEEEFRFWLKELLCKEEISKNARIKLNIVKAKVKCRNCKYEGGLKITHEHNHSHPLFLCPSCKDSNIDIKEGRDCILKRVEVEI
ncbi:MAG: hydrogenase/urease maturation nickel metallochaperone HypA [Candidatus Ratteibacteria bacterium]|nr:hydrogenase/urease maturation nickel metallochaperone HypA [Candidatus Ratteibacteria bacterium]